MRTGTPGNPSWSQKEIVFLDVSFLFQPVEMKRCLQPGMCCFVLFKKSQTTLIRHSTRSSATKFRRDGNENRLNLSSGTEGLWVLTKKSGVKENDRERHPYAVVHLSQQAMEFTHSLG